MLSARHREIVTATVPLLETGGEALADHFYRLMLAEYPEVRPLFNQAHQASGAQPRALANAVLMYAKHIDHLDQLGGLVSQVINKHVALQVMPEHYPIVGTCLLRSIREVLGPDIATDEVIDAWRAAYEQLAGILIGAEEQLYRQTADAPGGWRGGRWFRITRVATESSEISSFYLEPEDGGPVVKHEPGQYIGLRLQIDGQEVRRNYSLSAMSNGRDYRISVKREPDGVASNALHQMVPGDKLELFAPAGDFALQPSDKPLVLISGGVGITPTVTMLEAALNSNRQIYFIHCARNADAHAFRDTVDSLALRHDQLKRFYCYSEHHGADPQPDAIGLLSQEMLNAWLPTDRDLDAYFLGPKPFMASVRKQLHALGVPPGQTHFEFFGPASALE